MDIFGNQTKILQNNIIGTPTWDHTFVLTMTETTDTIIKEGKVILEPIETPTG